MATGQGQLDSAIEKLISRKPLSRQSSSAFSTDGKRENIQDERVFSSLEVITLPSFESESPETIEDALILSNNRIIAVAKGGISLHVWDIVVGCYLGELEGHVLPIARLLSSEFGEVVSYSEDQTIRIWDIFSMNCLGVTNFEESEETEFNLFISDMKDITWIGRNRFAFHRKTSPDADTSSLVFMELSATNTWKIRKELESIPFVLKLYMVTATLLACVQNTQFSIFSIDEDSISVKQTFLISQISVNVPTRFNTGYDIVSMFSLEYLSKSIKSAENIQRKDILCLQLADSIVFMNLSTRGLLQVATFSGVEDGGTMAIAKSFPIFSCTQLIALAGDRIYQWSLTDENSIRAELSLVEELVGHHGNDVQIIKSETDNMLLSFANDGMIVVWKNGNVDEYLKDRQLEMMLAKDEDEFIMSTQLRKNLLLDVYKEKDNEKALGEDHMPLAQNISVTDGMAADLLVNATNSDEMMLDDGGSMEELYNPENL